MTTTFKKLTIAAILRSFLQIVCGTELRNETTLKKMNDQKKNDKFDNNKKIQTIVYF